MKTQGHNGVKAEQLNSYLATIDDADDELASMLGAFRASCKGPRDRIKNAKAMAKEAGVNPVAFAELIAARRAERAKQKRLGDLEADDLDDYNAMVTALGEFGDTPLGSAALAKAKPRGEDALDGLDDGHVPPPVRADEGQLAELGRG